MGVRIFGGGSFESEGLPGSASYVNCVSLRANGIEDTLKHPCGFRFVEVLQSPSGMSEADDIGTPHFTSVSDIPKRSATNDLILCRPEIKTREKSACQIMNSSAKGTSMLRQEHTLT